MALGSCDFWGNFLRSDVPRLRDSVSKLVFRFKKPPCATALLGDQRRIAGKLKDRLGKPSTIAVADDVPGLAGSFKTSQFAEGRPDKNSGATSSGDAINIG